MVFHWWLSANHMAFIWFLVGSRRPTTMSGLWEQVFICSVKRWLTLARKMEIWYFALLKKQNKSYRIHILDEEEFLVLGISSKAWKECEESMNEDHRKEGACFHMWSLVLKTIHGQNYNLEYLILQILSYWFLAEELLACLLEWLLLWQLLV